MITHVVRKEEVVTVVVPNEEVARYEGHTARKSDTTKPKSPGGQGQGMRKRTLHQDSRAVVTHGHAGGLVKATWGFRSSVVAVLRGG